MPSCCLAKHDACDRPCEPILHRLLNQRFNMVGIQLMGLTRAHMRHSHFEQFQFAGTITRVIIVRYMSISIHFSPVFSATESISNVWRDTLQASHKCDILRQVERAWIAIVVKTLTLFPAWQIVKPITSLSNYPIGCDLHPLIRSCTTLNSNNKSCVFAVASNILMFLRIGFLVC